MEFRSTASWEESIHALPDLPDPWRTPVTCPHNPFEYPFYRSRADTELEPVVISNIESQVRLRSFKSRERINAIYVNNSSYEVQLVWLNYDGNEVAYDRISPYTICRLSTFKTHPWIFRDVKSRRRLNWNDQQVVYCEQAPIVQLPGLQLEHYIIINPPSLIEWTEQSHKAFPAGFKRSVAAFLMSHKHCLRHAARKEGRGRAMCTLSDLPAELVARVIKIAAPEVWQQINCPFPEGSADLRPAKVPCTKELTLEWFTSYKPQSS
ncbi:probable von Hippel-Lindau disease tumor suppressor at N-terminal half [Coccomyxa sp. Obi]|nr:probable von Hippel-Lindau disease tumor suppressor at N-terminal half [Coccomyxa sp. Obi]